MSFNFIIRKKIFAVIYLSEMYGENLTIRQIISKVNKPKQIKCPINNTKNKRICVFSLVKFKRFN